ncbi:hypothetical protein WMY93_014590 [Mugilogobius chulae]|uniref:Uncharacterized protein n=1 Tax=Mugilogobius chulae TaxID=88201 RepID=A0AAW0NZG0_9GOBI
MAAVNKSVKQRRGKSKSVRLDASGRAPPAMDVRRDSESSEDFLERLVRTLKVDVQGLSPLHVACLQGHLGSLQHLLESGEWWINSSDDSQGRRPLHMVLSIQSSPQARAGLQYLLEQGADVNLTTDSGQTPLHVAAAQGQIDYAQILLEAGANLFARDHSGLLPLDMARMWNRRKMGRIPALGHFQPKDIEDIPHKACPQGRSISAWTDVAMHLQENLQPGHY